MKILYYLGLCLMTVLSLAAGGAKVLNMEQEVQLFLDANIDPDWLLPLGVLQIFGSSLALVSRTRKAAAILIASGFLISTFAIFRTGNAQFAIVSLLPIVLCAAIFWRPNPPGLAA